MVTQRCVYQLHHLDNDFTYFGLTEGKCKKVAITHGYGYWLALRDVLFR